MVFTDRISFIHLSVYSLHREKHTMIKVVMTILLLADYCCYITKMKFAFSVIRNI